MRKRVIDIIYICIHLNNVTYVLPYRNGLAAARITTHLIEDMGLHVDVVTSLDHVDSNIGWIFSGKRTFTIFLPESRQKHE